MIKFILLFVFFTITAQAQFIDLPQANLNGLTTDDLDEGVVNLYGSSAILTSSVNNNTTNITTLTTSVDDLTVEHTTFTSSINDNADNITTLTSSVNDSDIMRLATDQIVASDKTFTSSLFSDNLTQNIVSSTDMISAINNIDFSQYNENNSGFHQWTSGTDAATWTLTGSDFTVDRAGEGFINGKIISWAAGQTVTALANNSVHFIYVDTDGVLKSRTSFTPITDPYSSYIVLFLVLTADDDSDVARDNHDYSKDIQIARYLHKNVGIVVQNSGGIISRYLTGTGTSTGDRALSISAGTLDDSGLETTITATDYIDMHEWYINPSAWREHSHGTNEISMLYNSAGTPTALGVGKRGVVTIFSTKDNIEDTSGIFFALMGTAEYNNLAAAQAAIVNGNNTSPTGYLTKFDLCQLGHLIILNNADGGYIEEVIVERNTFNNTYGGGDTHSHSLLTDLEVDDHAQYVLLAGRSGQVVDDSLGVTGTLTSTGQIRTTSQFVYNDGNYDGFIKTTTAFSQDNIYLLPDKSGTFVLDQDLAAHTSSINAIEVVNTTQTTSILANTTAIISSGGVIGIELAELRSQTEKARGESVSLSNPNIVGESFFDDVQQEMAVLEAYTATATTIKLTNTPTGWSLPQTLIVSDATNTELIKVVNSTDFETYQIEPLAFSYAATTAIYNYNGQIDITGQFGEHEESSTGTSLLTAHFLKRGPLKSTASSSTLVMSQRYQAPLYRVDSFTSTSVLVASDLINSSTYFEAGQKIALYQYDKEEENSNDTYFSGINRDYRFLTLSVNATRSATALTVTTSDDNGNPSGDNWYISPYASKMNYFVGNHTIGVPEELTEISPSYLSVIQGGERKLYEDFNRANGAPANDWTTNDTGTSGSYIGFAINAKVLWTVINNGNIQTICYRNLESYLEKDTPLLIEFDYTSSDNANGSHILGVYVSTLSGNNGTEGVGFESIPMNSTASIKIDGSVTNLTSQVYNTGANMKHKLYVSKTRVKLKVWNDSGAEPQKWLIERQLAPDEYVEDGAYLKIMHKLNGSNAVTSSLDNIKITKMFGEYATNGTVTGIAGNKLVHGTELTRSSTLLETRILQRDAVITD